MSSPKVYFIKNEEGKFYNSRDKHFYNDLINANYDKNKKGIEQQLIINPIFKDCFIHEISEEDLVIHFMNQTTKTVLAGSYFSRHLTELDSKLPTISQMNKNIHKKMNICINDLKPLTSHYIDFLKQQEDRTDDVMGHYEEFIHLFSSVKIEEMPVINALIKAYKQNDKPMIGIAKKILKSNL